MALFTGVLASFIPCSLSTVSLVNGYMGGLFSSPCATPVLVVLRALVAKQGSLIGGIVLLLIYSIGHSILVLIAGTSVGFVKKLSASDKYGKLNHIFKIVMGTLILLLGFYMVYRFLKGDYPWK